MSEDDREMALKPIRQHNFGILLSWLHTLLAQPVNARKYKILEVGCAHGWFLEMAGKDYEVLGIEPDRAVADVALKKTLNVRIGFFPSALQADEKFDVIVFNDVLEHIPDVKKVVSECETRLTQGGLILINAPDKQGFFYRLSKFLVKLGVSEPFDRMWQVGLPSPHVYYFHDASMIKIASNARLKVTNSISLSSIVTTGLYQRIRYTNSGSKFKSAFIALGVLILIPLLRVFHSDITVWALKRSEDQQVNL
jgi:2-polyprenyl-3-methyl-5-hydroxy-6-metoxy-1,4-benzoquinol methylase